MTDKENTAMISVPIALKEEIYAGSLILQHASII
jgi:hypothetical protein